MRRALVAAVLAAAVGSLAQEGLDEVYEAPEVEPSVLEQHEAATHEAGQQYDFVKDEVAAGGAGFAEEGEGGAMHPAMEQLSQLLGGALLGRGHRVQLVQGEGDQGPSRLVEALKQMGGALTQSAGGKEQKETGRRSRPKSALPPILPGTPITEVLRTIRQTLAAAAANAEPDDDEEEDDEDAAAVLNSMLGTGAASSQLRSSGGGGSGGGEADESTDSYASRLATEARKRERASRGGAEDDDAADGEGEVFQMQLPEEVLRRFLSGANNLEGNADGEEAVTQMKIYVTGPDGEAREMQVNEGDVNGHASSIFDIIRRVTEKQTDDDDSAGTRGGGDSGSTATGDDAIGGKGTEPEI